jgi:hypothetical protein
MTTVRLEELGQLKNSITHRIRTRDHPACSEVPQPTTLPGASRIIGQFVNDELEIIYNFI